MTKMIESIRRWMLLFIILFNLLLGGACSKVILICNERDTVEQAGIDHFQKFVEIIEQFKKINGKYPKTVTEVNQNIIGTGNGFSNTKITGASYSLKPEENYFDVKFYFDREKTCLTVIGNNRACEYTSVSKKWTCY